jgi:KaiC/GvpD/RAD55 family RecA-like ATPase
MNLEKQQLLIEYALSNPDLFAKINHILKPTFVDTQLQRSINFIKDYYEKYKALPNADQITVESGKRYDTSKVLARSELAYTENEWESFCRQKAIEEAIMSSPALIDKGDYSTVEKMIRDAISVGLIKNVGLDYFLDPEDRIKRYLTLNNMISTGWPELDDQLNGGLNRKEMTLFAGLPGCITADETVSAYVFTSDIQRNRQLVRYMYQDHHYVEGMADDSDIPLEDLFQELSTHLSDAQIVASANRADHAFTFDDINHLRQLVTGIGGIDRVDVKRIRDAITHVLNEYMRSAAKNYTLPQLIENHFDAIIYIDTPDGFQPIGDLVVKPIIACHKLITGGNYQLSADENHLVERVENDGSTTWVPIKDVEIGDYVRTRDGQDVVAGIIPLGQQVVYDLEVQHVNHRYWGGSGISSHNTGKSLFLANASVNMLMRGLNVIYITLELSEEVVAKRFDSIVSGVGQADILKNINKVATDISNKANSWGKLFIKRMPESTTCANHIRAYLKEFELMNGIIPDVIAIDYLDLMSPNSKVSAEAIFIKDKYVSEEVRSIGNEYDCIVLSASQFGRGGYQSAEKSDQSSDNIAGGISKVNTTDNLFAIIQSEQMKTKGEYMLKLLKTRSSSGVGNFVPLSWDSVSLRIGSVSSDKKLGRANFRFDRNKDDPSALILGEDEAAKLPNAKKLTIGSRAKDISTLIEV